MTKFEKIGKLNELKKKLDTELLKEEKDQLLINKLHGQIITLGLTLTANDFVK